MNMRIVTLGLSCLIISGCGLHTSDREAGDSALGKLRHTPKPNSVVSPILEQISPLQEQLAQTPEPTVPSVKEKSISTIPEEQNKENPSKSSTKKQPKQKKPSVAVQQHRISQKKVSLAELRSKYPDFFKLNGSSGDKKMALTFDDGPDLKFTPQILDVLQKYHVTATFFLVGFRAEAHPDIVKRIVNEGHTIGNHSYNHANPAKLSEAQFERQIESAQGILQRLIGYSPKLIRTPYGAINEEQLKWAASHDYVVVNWDVDSLDWKGLTSVQVSKNILNHTHGGCIVLQHSAGGDKQDLSGTVKALPSIIQKLKADGYELVSVPQLLHISKSK